MASQLEVRYLRRRLKAIHLAAILAFLVFFCLLFLLGINSQANTYHAQLILLGMSAVVLFGYLSLSLMPPEREKFTVQLFAFYALSILTSMLVWATGLLYSPFITLYVIIIIISTQLYGYVHGLFQTLLASAGFVFTYGLVVNHFTPYHSILVDAKISLVYQPEYVIMIYGILYVLLFAFTVLASSSARILLFRAKDRSELNSTYQEKIIQEMPMAVVVTDSLWNILGVNPAAEMAFSYNRAKPFLGYYVGQTNQKLSALVKALVRSSGGKVFTWKDATGGKTQVSMSARIVPAEKKNDQTYIFFVEKIGKKSK
ncbi:MAG: hypothetical protein ABII02_01055 [Candidatus Magasanikbacteria bacterium]